MELLTIIILSCNYSHKYQKLFSQSKVAQRKRENKNIRAYVEAIHSVEAERISLLSDGERKNTSQSDKQTGVTWLIASQLRVGSVGTTLLKHLDSSTIVDPVTYKFSYPASSWWKRFFDFV